MGLFEAFSRLDGRGCAAWVLRFAGEEQACPDPDAFAASLGAQFAGFREAGAFTSGDASNGAEALAAVLESVRQHGVSLPGHICSTVVTMLVLEGWSHTLDPHHSTLGEVRRLMDAKRGSWWAWVNSAVDAEVLARVPSFSPSLVT